MSKTKTLNNQLKYEDVVKPHLPSAPWILRVTELKDKPVPVFIIKERIPPEQRRDIENLKAPRAILKERGLIYGEVLVRLMPILKTLLAKVCDDAGIPLELHHFFNGKRITFRDNLPLDDEAGLKFALIFKLREGIKEMDRVELMARRVDRFTREEASYWFSRMTHFDDPANRWSASGMKIMLAGPAGDKNIQHMLKELRYDY